MKYLSYKRDASLSLYTTTTYSKERIEYIPSVGAGVGSSVGAGVGSI